MGVELGSVSGHGSFLVSADEKRVISQQPNKLELVAFLCYEAGSKHQYKQREL